MRPPFGAKFVFQQERDDLSTLKESYHSIEVEAVDAGAGVYLTIKTKRWAMDPEELDGFIERLKWCVSQCKGFADEK